MNVKGKAKQLFCMVCAFIASFLVTVTAFANDDYDSENKNFFGTYRCNAISLSKSLITVRNDGYCDITAYWDLENKEFYSGRTSDFKISNSPTNFFANYKTVKKVISNGTEVKDSKGNSIIIDGYVASGDVSIDSSKIKIRSNQCGLDYVLEK